MPDYICLNRAPAGGFNIIPATSVRVVCQKDGLHIVGDSERHLVEYDKVTVVESLAEAMKLAKEWADKQPKVLKP